MKFSFTFLFQILLTSLIAQTLTVTTITEPFDASGGVKIGPDGMLYIGNFGEGLSTPNGTQIWRVHPQTGEREVFATGFLGASGNSFDSQKNFFFQSNIGGNKISKVTLDGTVSTFATDGIVGPVGIAIDGEDNLYVCNCNNNTIRKISAQGVSEAFAGGLFFKCPNGITLDHAGNLYVSNFSGSNNIIKITPNGTPSIFANVPGGNNGHLTYFAADSIFYVNSHANSSIYRMTLDGVVTKIAGSGQRGNADGNGLSATFSRPNGVAVSVTGDTLWVNSSIPTQDNPAANFYPLNPSVVRMVTNLKGLTTGSREVLQVPVKVSVSPNPASEKLWLQLTLQKKQKLAVQLFDMLGREVKSELLGELPIGKQRIALRLSGLVAGQYYLIVSGEEGSVTEMVEVF